jgi:hypothetical protein
MEISTFILVCNGGIHPRAKAPWLSAFRIVNADTMSRFELEQYLFDMTNAVDSHSIRG